MPHRAEEITATLAGPPEEEPAAQLARLIKKLEIPVRSKNAPKIINMTINFWQAEMGVPMMPLVV